MRAALEASVASYEKRFGESDIPRPAYWRGWRLAPLQIEFWHDGAFRLHDRSCSAAPISTRRGSGAGSFREESMTWSAAQYVKFESERTRPVVDLVARLPVSGVRRAADIGCGPGNSTEVLRARYPDAEIVGIDSSADMIAAARKRLPDIAFEIADIVGWGGVGYDVILANAVIQWIPGHESLLPALVANLAPGGALAVQTPDNLDEPSHVLMREVAAAGPWAENLADAAKARAARRDPDWYYRLLRRHASRVDIWRTTYFHPLAGAEAVVEWVKGTGLRPFLDPLDASEREAYLEAYQAAIADAYPAEADGVVVLPFPRLFFVATR